MKKRFIVSHVVTFLIGIQLGYLLCLTSKDLSPLVARDMFDVDNWDFKLASTDQNSQALKKSNVSNEDPIERIVLKNQVEEHDTLKIPEGTKFCLIHIGKTAGRSIACELGQGLPSPSEGKPGIIAAKDLLCYKYNPEPSALTHAFAGRSHVWGKGCESKRYSAYIYTLRNPLERLVSWYFYENPKKCKYARRRDCSKKFFKWENSTDGCFASLEDFAIHTIPPLAIDHFHTNINRSYCTELAWEVATGRIKCYAHNALGYAYYYRRMKQLEAIMKHNHPDDANKQMIMLAIRTEYLMHDWDTLDKAFGGKDWKPNGYERFSRKPESQVSVRKTDNETMALNELSLEGRLNLCNALCFEIQVYKTLLHMAENLNEVEVRKSIQEVIDSCPGETFEVRDCPPPNHATRLYDFREPFEDPISCSCKVS